MRIVLIVPVVVCLMLTGCRPVEKTRVSGDTNLIWPAAATAAQADPGQPGPEAISEPGGVLTLRQALALTLMANPELKAFALETRAAQARELQAGLRPNPILELAVEDVGGSGEQRGFGAAETTIQLSQLIELGSKAQKRRRLASLEKELAGWDYQAKRLEVLTKASSAYIELLIMQERVKLFAELVEVSEQTVRSVTQRVEAGKDSPLEKTRASIALAGVQLDYKQALRELETARKTAASFWGNEQPKFTRAEGQLEAVSDIPEMDRLRQQLIQAPQLARWKNEIDRSQAALALEKAKALPDISVGGGIKRFNESDDNAFVFGLAIPLPTADRNQGGRQEAAYNLSKSYEEQRAARIEMMNQFNQIFTELSVSLNKIKELRASILPGAREVFDAARGAYQEGKIDYLNVLDAQRTYFLSQKDYFETLGAYHQAKMALEGLIGQGLDAIKPINE